MSVFNFFPEGWKNEKIESTNGILQGFVTNCDKDFNLHVELENGEKGIIPREEVEAINVDENGIPKANLCEGKVHKFVQFKLKEKDKKWLNKHINTLKKEISLIGGNPTIVAFGDAVYRLLLENRCGLCNREKPIKIEKVPHFSRNSREKVKEQVEALKYFK